MRYFALTLTIAGLLIISSCGIDYDFSDTILAKNFYTTMDENPALGAEIGKIHASSSYGRMNFEILTQNPEGAFAVTEKKGELSVSDSTKFDFEKDSTIIGQVIISNNQMADTVSVEITLVDLPE